MIHSHSYKSYLGRIHEQQTMILETLQKPIIQDEDNKATCITTCNENLHY
jgi:hypothetical protein